MITTYVPSVLDSAMRYAWAKAVPYPKNMPIEWLVNAVIDDLLVYTYAKLTKELAYAIYDVKHGQYAYDIVKGIQ